MLSRSDGTGPFTAPAVPAAELLAEHQQGALTMLWEVFAKGWMKSTE